MYNENTPLNHKTALRYPDTPVLCNKIELLFLMKYVRTIQVPRYLPKDPKFLGRSSGQTVQTEISLLLMNRSD